MAGLSTNKLARKQHKSRVRAAEHRAAASSTPSSGTRPPQRTVRLRELKRQKTSEERRAMAEIKKKRSLTNSELQDESVRILFVLPGVDGKLVQTLEDAVARVLMITSCGKLECILRKVWTDWSRSEAVDLRTNMRDRLKGRLQ